MRFFASSLYMALAAVILLVLSLRVIRLRYRYGVEIGDGGQAELARARSALNNFAEHVPIALLLILMSDLIGHAKWTVHALGIALIVGRVLHPLGMATAEGPNAARSLGVGLTVLVIAAGALLALLGFAGLRLGVSP